MSAIVYTAPKYLGQLERVVFVLADQVKSARVDLLANLVFT